MEGRNLDQERRDKIQGILERHALDWIIVIPLLTLIGALGLMILFGVLHLLGPNTIPALGWWTCVGGMFGILVLIKVIETASQRFRKG